MALVLARLNHAVPWRYTVHHTNNHQTLTAQAIVCHQVSIYEQNIRNPPPGFDKGDIEMLNYTSRVERGEKVGRKPGKLWWVVYLPILIVWYDWNTIHYSDFKLRLK
jgi:hypothetical protein